MAVVSAGAENGRKPALARDEPCRSCCHGLACVCMRIHVCTHAIRRSSQPTCTYACACIQVLYPEDKPCDGENERRSAHGFEALDRFAAHGDENVSPTELGYRNSQRCERSARQHLPQPCA
jgi:hypothetical protein